MMRSQENGELYESFESKGVPPMETDFQFSAADVQTLTPEMMTKEDRG